MYYLVGYVLSDNLRSCLDDDECERGICGENTGDCINTEGSFICVCEEGYHHNTTVACEGKLLS